MISSTLLDAAPRYYNLQSVKAKQAAKASTKAKKKEKEEDADEDGDGSEGSVESEEAEALLTKEEGMADDSLGGPDDPDGGYDYEGLLGAMQDGRPAGSDDEEDEGDAGEHACLQAWAHACTPHGCRCSARAQLCLLAAWPALLLVPAGVGRHTLQMCTGVSIQ